MESDVVQKDYSQYVKLSLKESLPNRPIFTPVEIDALFDHVEAIEYADIFLCS